LGDADEAKSAISRLLEILPGYTQIKHSDRMWIERENDRQRLLEGLKLAGLPA
jgi:hypothetical protein